MSKSGVTYSRALREEAKQANRAVVTLAVDDRHCDDKLEGTGSIVIQCMATSEVTEEIVDLMTKVIKAGVRDRKKRYTPPRRRTKKKAIAKKKATRRRRS